MADTKIIYGYNFVAPFSNFRAESSSVSNNVKFQIKIKTDIKYKSMGLNSKHEIDIF